jgi:tRNA uridine 5-carbamoylmethylation protein Kti12
MSYQKVFILRGVPGSGKSTYIKNKVKEIDERFGYAVDVQIVSADFFFNVCNCDFKYQYVSEAMRSIELASHLTHCPKLGYKFDATKLGLAHSKCQDDFTRLIDSKEPMIVFVDNTNTTIREMEFYTKMCVGNDVEFVVVNINCDPEVAAARNVHGVPLDKIRQMQARIKDADSKWPKEWPREEYNDNQES